MRYLSQRALVVVLLLMPAAWIAPAQATAFYGEYDGYVSRQVFWGMEDPSAVGRPTTGKFFFDTSFFTLESATSSLAWYSYNNLLTHENSLWIGQDGYADIPHLGAHTIRLERAGGKDILYLSSYGPGGGYGRSILLVGDEGSFFNELNLSSLRAGPIDLTASRAYTGIYREDDTGPGTFISFYSARFEAMAVPEPSAFVLSAMALALAMGMRRTAT